MVAIVTDIHYRMSLALLRDLGEAGVDVICCESDRYQERASSPPLGALSRHCKRHVWMKDDNYASSLLELCREVGETYRCRPVLLPVGAATLASVAAAREKFSEVASLLIPTVEQLDLFNSKEKLAALAREMHIPTPESFERRVAESPEDFVHRLTYPCVIKPVCGEKYGLSAAQRYVFAHSPEEALSAFRKYKTLAGEDPVVQRRLMGGGLGLSVLTMDGTVVHSICHRRLREYPVTGGPSTCCQTESREDLLDYVRILVKETGYSGLAMFEFKEDSEGNPYLLEVNPRIWGTFPLTRASKSGLSLLWCILAWNMGNTSDTVEIPPILEPEKCKMIFAASDLMAAFKYFRSGKPMKSFQVLLDFLNPHVRDGVFEWNDIAPGAAYFRSLLAKEKH